MNKNKMLTNNYSNDIIITINIKNKIMCVTFTILSTIAFLILLGIAFKSDTETITLTETFLQTGTTITAFAICSKLAHTFNH